MTAIVERGVTPLHAYYLSQAEGLIKRAGQAGLAPPVIEAHIVNLGCKQDKLNAILAEFEEQGFGMVLQGMGSWAVILRDPTEEGRFRYQTFNEKGFSGHVTRSHVDEVILDAFKSGYCEVAVDQTILDRLSQTDAWKRGMAAVHLTQQVNQGLITFVEADALFRQSFAQA